MPGVTEAWTPEAAARWIAEAFETGDPLAPLPPGIAPCDREQGEEVAGAVLEALSLPANGLRLAGEMVGPAIAARVLPDGAPVALGALRHARASAAVIGVLAEALEPDTATPPAFAALQPALDIAASRFSAAPADPAVVAADLGGIGLILAGRPVRGAMPGPARIALGPPRGRRWDGAVELADLFARAAAEARARGGLPVGALLVVAGLTAPVTPEGGQELAARIEGLGRVGTRFA